MAFFFNRKSILIRLLHTPHFGGLEHMNDKRNDFI